MALSEESSVEVSLEDTVAVEVEVVVVSWAKAIEFPKTPVNRNITRIILEKIRTDPQFRVAGRRVIFPNARSASGVRSPEFLPRILVPDEQFLLNFRVEDEKSNFCMRKEFCGIFLTFPYIIPDLQIKIQLNPLFAHFSLEKKGNFL